MPPASDVASGGFVARIGCQVLTQAFATLSDDGFARINSDVGGCDKLCEKKSRGERTGAGSNDEGPDRCSRSPGRCSFRGNWFFRGCAKALDLHLGCRSCERRSRERRIWRSSSHVAKSRWSMVYRLPLRSAPKWPDAAQPPDHNLTLPGPVQFLAVHDPVAPAWRGAEPSGKAQNQNNSSPVHLAIDSTGLKVFDEGEWICKASIM